MKLGDIFNNKTIDRSHWVDWRGDTFVIEEKKPKAANRNRETLAQVYVYCVKEVERQGVSLDIANRFIRSLWIEESPPKRPKQLPRIIGEDGFLRHYALGIPLSVDLFHRIWR